MAEPPQGDRDRKTDEDLFEDLDQFFAPLEETDWPEGAVGDPATQGTPTRRPQPTEAEGDLGDLEGIELDLPEPEASPAGEPPRDVPAAPSAAEEPAPTASPDRRAEGEEDRGGPAEAAETWDEDREEDWIAAATAEMAPEDWDRLPEQDAVGRPAAAPAERPEPPGAPPVGAAPPGAASEAPPIDQPLTIDDLRSPPPEYADLPTPEEERAPAEEATLEDLQAPLAVDDEPLPPMAAPPRADAAREEAPPVPLGEAAAPPAPPAPPQLGAPEEEEERVVAVAAEQASVETPPAEETPPEEAVEAAADHFASGLSEPEDVERDLLADVEAPDSRTAPIDRAAVAARAAAERRAPEPAEPDAELAPAWEGEGAHAAAPAPEPAPKPAAKGAPGERNLVAAFVTGILLAVLVIALLAVGKGAFAVLAGAVILLGQGELYAVMRRQGLQPATLLGLVSGGMIVAGAYIKGEGAVLFGLSLAMLLVVLWYMAAPPGARKGTVRDAGATLLGIVYVPFLASFAILLLALPVVRGVDVGRNVFLAVVGLTILYDICAYAIGSLWGSRPLAPTISPRKSWEGAIGATFVLLLAALAIVPSIDPFTAGPAVALAVVIAIAAPIGDLVESAVKRDLGVKDMSGLLPGHGGILDRIDAILFTAPAAYWLLRIVFFS